MWLNDQHLIPSAIDSYRASLLSSCPNHIVIDNLFNESKLDEVIKVLRQGQHWQTQKHTYSALYVDNAQWQETSHEQRFVKRDVWQRKAPSPNTDNANNAPCLFYQTTCPAQGFLAFLRGDEFMSLLSGIFNVRLTDMNVAKPEINSNYFRLGPGDFVEQHADDSPGREVCMLLYLNKQWNHNAGGELVFMAKDDEPIRIAPVYNRCVLFDPFSEGSEHWVETLNGANTADYRYNLTSWYWSE
jgi:SM-20-related protein